MLEPKLCRGRQQRLLNVMQEQEIEWALLRSPENVQWLTGFRPHKLMSAVVGLQADGECYLSAPNSEPENVAADRVVTFEAQWHSTLRQEQARAALEALKPAFSIPSDTGRIGVEFSTGGSDAVQFLNDGAPAKTIDLDPLLWQLRRNKDDDEFALISRAVDCTHAMYQRAREIIQPGITELEVFNQLHAAAVEVAGEPLTDIGNDFQCNSPGGPPRNRAAKAGELYILDLGPAYRGYYADNCRTFAVNRQPTDEQMQAWEVIVAALEMVEQTIHPGVSCRQLFEQAQEMLDEYRPGSFFHHLGHGIGLYPHEAPHLNPRWDDTFEEGDIFTAEPGLYCDELQAGIRLEQNYIVTGGGVERLTSFPLDL